MKDHCSRRSHEILTGLLNDPTKKHILLSIRSITVNSVPKRKNWRIRTEFDKPTRQAHEKKWLLFADLLSRIPHLKSFTLQGTDQISVALLDAFERYHPQAHLHVQNWTRIEDDEDHNNAAEIALARSPNLRSLQARLWDTTYIDLHRGALKRIVAVSPNLDTLDISEGSSGLVRRVITPEESQQTSVMLEKFSEDAVPSSNSILSLSCRGTYHALNLGDVTDLSKLELLEVGRVADIYYSGNNQWHGEKFPRLKHLSFTLDGPRVDRLDRGIELFLYTCSPLQSLKVTDGAIHLPLSVISPHANTLRTLVWHNTEMAGSEASSYAISLREVQELSERCHILEDITIDAEKLSVEGGMNEILAALAAFPLLHTIRIYIPLGVAEEAARTPHMFLDEDETRAEIEAHCRNPFNPMEDSCWLENAWSLLRHEKKKNGSRPLMELHVKVGEWEREMSSGYPAGWVVWEAANRRYFIATPHERDDRPNDINIYTKGTKPYSNVDSHEIRRIPEFVDLWDCGLPS